jgi:uncharacterized protein YeaO (DUF488 family)
MKVKISKKGAISVWSSLLRVFGVEQESLPYEDQFCGSFKATVLKDRQEVEINGILGKLAMAKAYGMIITLASFAGKTKKEIQEIRMRLPSLLKKAETLTGKVGVYAKSLINKGHIVMAAKDIIYDIAAMFNIGQEKAKTALPKLVEYFSYKLKINLGRKMRVLVMDEELIKKAGFRRDPFDGFMYVLNPSWISRVAMALMMIKPSLTSKDANKMARTNGIQFLAGRDRYGKSGILKGIAVIAQAEEESGRLLEALKGFLPVLPVGNWREIDAIAGPGTLKLGEGPGLYEVDVWLRQPMGLTSGAKVSNQLIRLRLTDESKKLVQETVASNTEKLYDYNSFRELVNLGSKEDDNLFGSLAKLKSGIGVKPENMATLIKAGVERTRHLRGGSAPVVPGIQVVDNKVLTLRPGECIMPRSAGLKVGQEILLGRSPIMDSAGFTNHKVVALWNRETVAVSDERWALNSGDYDGDRAIWYTDLRVTSWAQVVEKPEKRNDSGDLTDDEWRRLVMIETTMQRSLDVREASYNHTQAQLLLEGIVDVDLIHAAFGMDEQRAVDYKALRFGGALNQPECLNSILRTVTTPSERLGIKRLLKNSNRMATLLSMKGIEVADSSGLNMDGSEDDTIFSLESQHSKEKAIAFLNSWLDEVKETIQKYEGGNLPHTEGADFLYGILKPFKGLKINWDANPRDSVLVYDNGSYSWLSHPVMDAPKHIESYLSSVFGEERGRKASQLVISKLNNAWDNYAAAHKALSKIPYFIKGEVNPLRSEGYVKSMTDLRDEVEGIVGLIYDQATKDVIKGIDSSSIDQDELRKLLVYGYAYMAIVGLPVPHKYKKGEIAFRKSGYASSIIALNGSEGLGGLVKPAEWPIRRSSGRTPAPPPPSAPPPPEKENIINVYTSRIGESQKEAVDATTKAKHPLAPGWDIVLDLKNGKISWVQYKEEYLARLRKLWRQKPEEFLNLLKDGTVLVCYCKDHTQCHRTILAEVLVKIGKLRGINIIYGGEITSHSPPPSSEESSNEWEKKLFLNSIKDSNDPFMYWTDLMNPCRESFYHFDKEIEAAIERRAEELHIELSSYTVDDSMRNKIVVSRLMESSKIVADEDRCGFTHDIWGHIRLHKLDVEPQKYKGLAVKILGYTKNGRGKVTLPYSSEKEQSWTPINADHYYMADYYAPTAGAEATYAVAYIETELWYKTDTNTIKDRNGIRIPTMDSEVADFPAEEAIVEKEAIKILYIGVLERSRNTQKIKEHIAKNAPFRVIGHRKVGLFQTHPIFTYKGDDLA